MNLKTKSIIAGLSLAGMLGGCASIAPPQLIDARNAYAASSAGLASRLSPTELYDAKKALDTANREFDSQGDTATVRDYAYIATRKTELADVKARTAADRETIAEAIKQGVVVRDAQVKRAQGALADTREQLQAERYANYNTTSDLKAANAAQGRELANSASQLESERSQNNVATADLMQANAAQNKELAKTASQLEAEKVARLSAEEKLAGAMKDLATIAAVKEDARGVVITLTGSILFASGKFALLESAKTKLNHVAEALKSQSGEKTMVVEGHTDSQGTDSINQPLSLNRASAVRDYLVGRGVDTNRISAVGMGSTRPLLDNANAENRANNRRVEIIIQHARMTER
jgi:outer membrane protein OmpA-like peptidoglycan-associated protein